MSDSIGSWRRGDTYQGARVLDVFPYEGSFDYDVVLRVATDRRRGGWRDVAAKHMSLMVALWHADKDPTAENQDRVLLKEDIKHEKRD